jgi:thiol-disulfide isomerase/thioredoxin
MIKIIPYLFLVFLIFGCNQIRDDAAANQDDRKIEISAIDETGVAEIINNRQGKVLFINVWATWCAPCIEEFPDIVKIAEEYRESDVEVITLNVDMNSQIDSHVIPFLKKNNADLPVYNINDKSAEKVINLLNNKWSGAIPATFIYDKDGNQKIFILGKENYSVFKSAVDSVRSL